MYRNTFLAKLSDELYLIYEPNGLQKTDQVHTVDGKEVTVWERTDGSVLQILCKWESTWRGVGDLKTAMMTVTGGDLEMARRFTIPVVLSKQTPYVNAVDVLRRITGVKREEASSKSSDLHTIRFNYFVGGRVAGNVINGCNHGL